MAEKPKENECAARAETPKDLGSELFETGQTRHDPNAESVAPDKGKRFALGPNLAGMLGAGRKTRTIILGAAPGSPDPTDKTVFDPTLETGPGVPSGVVPLISLAPGEEPDNCDEVTASRNPDEPLYGPAPSAPFWWREVLEDGQTPLDRVADRCGLGVVPMKNGSKVYDEFEIWNFGGCLLSGLSALEVLRFCKGFELGHDRGFFEAMARRDQDYRPSLALFARLMESRLRANDGRGFETLEPSKLAQFAADQLADVLRLDFGGSKELATRRLVNAANFCMMAAQMIDGLNLEPSEIEPSNHE